MTKVLNVKSNAIIYALSNVLSSALPVIILPYLSTRLTVEEYGILTNFSLIVLFLGFFIGLQTASFLQRQFFVVDRYKFGVYFYNILLISFVTIAFLCLIYPFFHELTSIFFDGSDFFLEILAIGLSSYFINLLAVQKQMEQNARFVLTLRILQCSSELVFTYFFIENFTNPLNGRISAMWISNTGVGLLSAVYLMNKYITSYKISVPFIKESLHFGIPVFFNVIFGWIMTSSGRFFLSFFGSLQVAGGFSFSFQLAMVISLVGNSINQAWAPWLYKHLAESTDSSIKSIKKGVYYCISVILLATLFFIFVVPLLAPFVFDKEYEIDLIVFSLIAFGFALNTCYRILINFMFFEKRTKEISIITLSCASLNILLNYFLIPDYGSTGAAISSFASFALGLIIICIIVVKKKYLVIGVAHEEKTISI